MFTRGLSQPTQKNLELLSKTPFVSDYYLAGGTGLSLHFGHRFSHDLDFFAPEAKEPIVISSTLKELGKLEIFQNDKKTFNGELNGIKLSFFEYPYPLLNPLHHFAGINLAAIVDIACMKLEAISSRGKKRDFIDLYKICTTQKSLGELFQLFEKKYSEVRYNKIHILKSLVFFEDAEQDEIPVMIDKINWDDVKTFFQKEVKKITQRL